MSDLKVRPLFFPALTPLRLRSGQAGWANVCRAYGAYLGGLVLVLDKTVTDMVGFFCKEVRPGSRRDFCFWGRNIPNSEEVNPRSKFPKRTFKEERSMLRHYKDLPRQTSNVFFPSSKVPSGSVPCSKACGRRSMLRHYKDLPRQISSTKTKSRFLAPLGMTGRRLFQ